MKNKQKILDIVLITLLLIVIIISCILIYNNFNIKESVYQIQIESSESSDNIISLNNKEEETFDYLFESNKEEQYSNIVGHFGYNSFAWYVPDWLVQNWRMVKKDKEDLNMVFTPKEVIKDSPISDIVMEITTSTEIFNAETLFQNEKRNGDVFGEILLNQHTDGNLKILIEANTRIYHIQFENGDNMSDIYFIDGHDKTLKITFSADKKNFLRYSMKIRTLVEGIGGIKAIQG